MLRVSQQRILDSFEIWKGIMSFLTVKEVVRLCLLSKETARKNQIILKSLPNFSYLKKRGFQVHNMKRNKPNDRKSRHKRRPSL